LKCISKKPKLKISGQSLILKSSSKILLADNLPEKINRLLNTASEALVGEKLK